MSATKKLNSDSSDQINSRIQRKFDLVFDSLLSKKSATDADTGSISTHMNPDEDYGELEMTSSAKKKDANVASPIDLDFSIEDEINDDLLIVPQVKDSTSPGIEKFEATKSAPVENTDGLDFSLDFDAIDDMVPEKISAAASAAPASIESQTASGLTLASLDTSDSEGFDLENSFETEFAESTKKTIIISAATLSNVNLEKFNIEPSAVSDSTSDLMSTEEAKANIESTIKDILRPKPLAGGTQEIDLDQLQADSASLEEDNHFELNTAASDSFNLDVLMQDSSQAESKSESSATGEFSIDPSDFMVSEKSHVPVHAQSPQSPTKTEAVKRAPAIVEVPRAEIYSEEESVRTHATIRQMREEREELLIQIKTHKSERKDLEQDNLSLKAALDEAKIEITILRKRHMVELEDLKYRLTLSEERKSLADERARQAEMRREKLEQKVRIDYNQVKLREKELESKLEMLSMDIDAQVQGRDHKILELRRKIDALEFNMENVSIKEQRSNDDKRKLEDKLNKIMKTLRNSIKNLEEDIDQAQEDVPNSEKN